MRRSLRLPALVLVALLVGHAGWARGQSGAAPGPTLTGTWEITASTRGRGGRAEVLTLTQHADGSLTGAFVVESLRREEPISDGRAQGRTFSFVRDRAGSRYEGTFDGDRIQGSITAVGRGGGAVRGRAGATASFQGTRTSDEVISFAAGAPAQAAAPAAPNRPGAETGC